MTNYISDEQSLLSMPYLGFLDRDESTYLKTKDAMLSAGNPYFAAGPGFSGAGSVFIPVSIGPANVVVVHMST